VVSQQRAFPVAFERNTGQVSGDFRFVGRQNGVFIGFAAQHIRFAVATELGKSTYDLSFEYSRPTAIEGEQLLAGKVNYLRGSDSSHWKRNLPTFARVRYRNLYPGIDLVFYGNGKEMEHDFVVAPGTDPQEIVMKLSGEQPIRVLEDGALLLGSSERGQVQLRKPIAYQQNGRGRVEVAASYHQVEGKVKFELGAYDRTLPLIIDPVLSYSTYVADDYSGSYAIGADADGNSYVAGLTFDASYPTTAGAVQPTCVSCPNTPDLFITKLKADGSGQVYSTFLGGNDYDEPTGIVVDKNGNAIIAGRTSSKNFPLKNAVNTTAQGYAVQWGFVTSISGDGSALNFSTVLGEAERVDSTASTYLGALALDSGGNVYVTGSTNSPVFPTTPGALKALSPAYPNSAVFVSKFLADGSLGYSAIIGNASPTNGGGGPIGPAEITVDASGSAYIYGKAGTLWPITAGAFQTQISGDMPYAAPFVTKLAPDASTLVYSTFVGTGYQLGGLAINEANQAVLTGSGAEANYPVTPDAKVKSYPGANSSWITILNASGTSLLYSSFLTAGNAESTSMALDPTGNIWIVGSTTDDNFPLVHPVQALPGKGPSYPSQTGFVMELDGSAKQTLFSTYFGGATKGTRIGSVAADVNGKVHFTGFTQTDLYTTPNAFVRSVTPPLPNYYPTWPFAAKIDPSVGAPALCIDAPNNVAVGFGFVTVGTKANRTLNLRNCGTQPLSISSITVTDSVFSVPDNQNNCKSSLPTDGVCALVVQFSPVSKMTSNAVLRIATNSAIPDAAIPVSGNGAVPEIYTDITTMKFDPLLVGQTSARQFLVLDNNGFSPLQIDLSGTTITGDFSFTPTGCDVPLYLGQSCAFFVTFTPKNAGIRTGTISILSNDPVNPLLTIALTGMGLLTYPVPVLSQVDPPSVPITSATNVSLYGSNFFPQSVVTLNGTTLNTNYIGSTFLRATLDPSLFSGLGTANISVVNPVPGGGESSKLQVTLYGAIPLHPASLVSVPSSNLIYGAMPAYASNNPNTIVPIDPANGALQSPIAIGNDPRMLAASEDGKYLYVALYGEQVIKRIDLATLTVDRILAYPPNQVFAGTPMTVTDMHVVPGSPDSIVVAVGGMVALYRDNAIVNAVPASYPGITVNSFSFVGPDKIYALPFTTVQNHFFNFFWLDPSGIHFAPVTGTNFGPYDQTGAQVTSDGKLLYTRAGQVWDPATHVLTGTFPVSTYNSTSYPNLYDMTLDKHSNKVFLIGNQAYGNGSSALVLSAYDKQTFNLTGTAAWANLYSTSNLVRWGADGFAFIDSDGIVSIRSSIASAHLYPTSVNVGDQFVNTTTSSVITYANDTNSPITIQSIVASAGFSQSNNCPVVMDVEGTCTISVLSQPLSVGAHSGTLTVTDSSRAIPYVVSLMVNGVPPVAVTPTRPGRPGRPISNTNSSSVTVGPVRPTIPSASRPSSRMTVVTRAPIVSSHLHKKLTLSPSRSLQVVVVTPAPEKSSTADGVVRSDDVAENAEETGSREKLSRKRVVRRGLSNKSRDISKTKSNSHE
jgi:hypothetical protein